MSWQWVVVTTWTVGAVATTVTMLGLAYIRAWGDDAKRRWQLEREAWLEDLGPLSKVRRKELEG